MNFIAKIALRYIFAKTNDKFVSFIATCCLVGITIGVASLIVVMSIMNGFRHELTKCIIGLNGHIIVGANDIDTENRLKKYDFITGVGKLIEGQGLLSKNGTSAGVLLKGLTRQDLSIKPNLANNILGNLDDFEQSGNSMLIGSGLAANLDLQLGDNIRLIVPETVSSIFGSMPKAKDFQIVGIFNSGLTDYDSMNAIIPFASAEKIFGSQKAVFEVYTDKPANVGKYSKILYRDLFNYISFINNWQVINSATLDALKVEKVAMTAVLSLVIIVAAFNIIAGLFMLVKDKTKDIAILRTIGVSKSSIMLIFMLNGMIIGSIGTFLGVGLGQLIAHNINTIKLYLERFSGIKIFDAAVYFLYNLPARLETEDVWFVCAIALFMCFISTLYPAYRAAKLNPVDAIRYE